MQEEKKTDFFNLSRELNKHNLESIQKCGIEVSGKVFEFINQHQ